MSSVVGLTGNIGQTAYSATKAGVIAFTKSLALEVGRYGVTVNAVAPGFIETDMTAPLKERLRQKVLDLIPLKRFGQPEEVAHLVQFLASPESSYITGSVLCVTGGLPS
jgi:3-oxoacyl-[acyl-carrier protein] reductase